MKEIIKNEILEHCEITEDITQAIYIIDGVYIDGDFYQGIRGVDHNILINDGYGWEEVLSYGVVIVPETQTYISDYNVSELDEIGFTRLPLNNNHIVGFN